MYDDSSAHPSMRHSPIRSTHGHTSSSSGDDDSNSDEAIHGHETMTATDSAEAYTTATRPRPPNNPFSRTLADVDETLVQPATYPEKRPSPDAADSSYTAGQTSPRAAMDVDAFKNLLMTGKPPRPLPSTPAADPPAQQQRVLRRAPANTTTATSTTFALADSSSGTDTSSVSRQSLVDPMAGETPRTSYERSISDEEEDNVLPPQRTASKRVKPPPLPRHKHGKSVTTAGPQIVPFDAFSGAAPEEESVKSPEEDRHPRSSAELKRPLPPIPQPAARSDIAHAAMISSREPREQKDVVELSSQPKKPPPPPLARRSSQRAPTTPAGRSRSGTASSRPSLMEDNVSIAESTGSSTRVAPPPPPARRSGHAAPAATSDEGSTSSVNPSPSLKSPPLPPARNRASSTQSATSTLSNMNVTSPSTSTTSSAAGAMSPPQSDSAVGGSGGTLPPRPPPRRTSSRSSTEIVSSPRRTSSEIVRSSFDSERRPSMSNSVRRVPIVEEDSMPDGVASTMKSARDILADMDEFQKEIDALLAREDLTRRKGSAGSASLSRPAG
ncbi:hypothetical protein, variant [Verruconis gallopava]|nr:hypothetical protein, variant [Verruconis gallopava]KIW02810.1 hypothetical protein, variant [Verruconis gallopava]